MEVAKRIDDRSPVGDAIYWAHPAPPGYVGGHFRGAWMMTMDKMSSEDPGTIDPTGAVTLARAFAAIPQHAAGHVFFYTNSLPYAQALEEGHSRQAPHGLVALTALEFQDIVGIAVSAGVK